MQAAILTLMRIHETRLNKVLSVIFYKKCFTKLGQGLLNFSSFHIYLQILMCMLFFKWISELIIYFCLFVFKKDLIWIAVAAVVVVVVVDDDDDDENDENDDDNDDNIYPY